MNPHLLLGTLSFLAWSAFSTWYYVTHIKDFERRPDFVEGAEVPYEGGLEEEPEVAENSAIDNNIPEKEQISEEVELETLPPIQIAKRLQFHKNSIRLISPQELDHFVDSVQPILTTRDLEIEIVGHTCDLGTEKHNQQLGLRRAQFIAEKLATQVADEIVDSQGELDPLVPNISEKNRIKNRRVTIKITSL